MAASSDKKRVARAAGVVGAATLASRVGGFARDLVIAFFFGAGPAADAFFVAFRIPNLLRRLFAEGTLTIAFIPIFTEVLRQKGKQEAFLLARSTFGLLGLVLLGITCLGVLFAPQVVRAMAFGFQPGSEAYSLAVTLTRWCFPYVFFICLVALSGGVLNSMGHFFAPAAAPLLLNICLIASAAALAPWVDPPVLSLAFGVLAGGAAQLLLQLPYLRAKGLSLIPAWDLRNPALRRIIKLMGPAALGAAVYQFTVFINTMLASFLPTGSVSYLYYADRLIQFPLGIFAFAVSTAVLPTLSRQAADKDHQALVDTMGYSLRLTLFICLPAMVGLLVIPRPLLVLLLMRGEFGPDTATATAGAVAGYAAGIWAFAGARAVVGAFYSLKDTRTPVIVAAACLAINLVFALALMGPLKHVGLALATSISAAANLVGLSWLLRRRLGPLGGRKILRSAAGALMASIVMGACVWCLVYLPPWGGPDDWQWRILRPLVGVAAGAAAYLAAARAMGLAELNSLFGMLRRGKAGPG